MTKSTASQPFTPSSQGTGIRRAVRAGLGRIARTVEALRHRRQVRSLLELDDRALKDIGLVRNDVVGVLEVPVFHDPSVLLRLRAVQRRAHGRRDAAALRPVKPMRVAVG